ncbi:ribosomal protein S12 methylthiotransferase accessory factor [Nonomuraea solani]|uniref:Ribosomal protein S12 methylthiotransferase accessory factor n=1 Tax=Nonomuraea solani TaxID=1144553 RepID=A0A1H6EQX3_9ACTN|nr:YcaO-like family protein [Nonomuraea solani]SEH00212.1 ribosomal protein S12 methylthiotransferase accessory factor [Nonomuraea solani]
MRLTPDARITAERLAATAELLDGIGVSRVADITGLDVLGFPVFLAIRPEAEELGLCVHSGKGTTPAQAWMSAAMEAVEHHWAEGRHHADRIRRLPIRSMLGRDDVLDLKSLTPYAGRKIDLDRPYGWTEVRHLGDGHVRWAPAEAVFHPLHGQEFYLYGTETCGLAVGATEEEAILHGLCEVVEHDARALFHMARRAPMIEIGSLRAEAPAWRYIEAMRRAGLEVAVYDLTTDLGVCVIGCTIADPGSDNALLINNGYCCHPDKRRALLGALLEAAQSRLGFISGSRDDLDEKAERLLLWPTYADRRAHLDNVFDSPDGSVPWTAVADGGDLLGALAAAGYPDAYMTSLAPPGYPVHVVRVLVPHLQPLVRKGVRLGPRALRRSLQVAAGKEQR